VWAPDSVLNLLRHYIATVEKLDDEGEPTGEKKLIFPRYHQMRSVRRLVKDARSNGPGERYLIQHSAGSGKSISIAVLAHQLAFLHNDEDESSLTPSWSSQTGACSISRSRRSFSNSSKSGA
jgi:type I restriction enzyme R subunit